MKEEEEEEEREKRKKRKRKRKATDVYLVGVFPLASVDKSTFFFLEIKDTLVFCFYVRTKMNMP